LILETNTGDVGAGSTLLGSEYLLLITKSRSMKSMDGSLKPSNAYHKIITFHGGQK